LRRFRLVFLILRGRRKTQKKKKFMLNSANVSRRSLGICLLARSSI
jgi:hypothetical protein